MNYNDLTKAWTKATKDFKKFKEVAFKFNAADEQNKTYKKVMEDLDKVFEIKKLLNEKGKLR